jgi:S1-C subfamily serine protease
VVTDWRFVAGDPNPTIVLANGERRTATVIAADVIADLAVIELDEPTALPSVRWGSPDRLFTDPGVTVVERTSEGLTGRVAEAASINGVVGMVTRFSFGAGDFTPGAAVVDENGNVIGLIDAGGHSAIGGPSVQLGYSKNLLRRTAPAPACEPPAVEPAPTEQAPAGS